MIILKVINYNTKQIYSRHFFGGGDRYKFQKHLFLFVLFLAFSCSAYSQEHLKNDSVLITPLVDSLLVDRNLDNWSLRLYGVSKAQNFTLENSNIKLKYTPNNLFGIGVGVATSKIILDFSFNITDGSTENTNRFDIIGSYLASKHYFDFYLQVYEGFDTENSLNDNTVFRDDIKSSAIGVDYLFLFNGEEFNEMLVLSGLKKQKHTILSLGAGGFLLYNRVSADNSIVPVEFMDDFNEQAQLTRFTDYGLGAIGAFTGAFNLTPHWYFTFMAKAGLGVMVKKAETETLDYKPSDPMVYKLSAGGTFGYAKNRFYTYFNVGVGGYITDLDFGNDGTFTLLRAKWVFGYRFFKNKKK